MSLWGPFYPTIMHYNETSMLTKLDGIVKAHKRCIRTKKMPKPHHFDRTCAILVNVDTAARPPVLVEFQPRIIHGPGSRLV